MSKMQILKSQIDDSVNFILDREIGQIECRYVRRPGKDIIYVSSQTGCNQACRMCHLTAKGLVAFQNCTIEDFKEQVEIVTDYIFSNNLQQEKLHVNFMARGEPLNNPYVYEEWKSLSQEINTAAKRKSNFLISSIFPKSYPMYELNRFESGENTPRLYWSAYSANPAFRKQWLPRSCTFEQGLFMLSYWWRHTKIVPRIHFALIENKNDSIDDADLLCQELNKLNFRVDINLVQYNPYSEAFGAESPHYDMILEFLRKTLTKNQNHIKIIPRVGFDVKVSCGTFATDNE